MSDKEKRIILAIIKLLYLITVLCSFIALRLELDVYNGILSREQVDTRYMLDCIVASILILNGFAFLFCKYT